MSGASCPRLFEAEALRDGRLVGTERASFERHLTVCADCSREARALSALAEALRANADEHGNTDELHVRRERTRLLAAFDRSLLTPDSTWPVWRRLLKPAAAGVAALAVALAIFWRLPPVTQRAAHASNTVVQANGTAVWSKRTEANRENVVLERGALWIHVAHGPGEAPLLVVLPDGELEDTGTTFTVSAEDGRTTRVAVEEGSVVLRLRGRPPVTLGAGESWQAEARPAASVSPSVSPSALVGAPASEAPSVPSAIPVATPSLSPPPARSTPPTRSPEPSASAGAPDPSADFRAAMALLNRGDNARAAVAFAELTARHPQDPRAEDAAYLRVIAFQRDGAEAAMKEAAREYLRRYPTGFRRAEVEALAH
jgi:TolA-binding protein